MDESPKGAGAARPNQWNGLPSRDMDESPKGAGAARPNQWNGLPSRDIDESPKGAGAARPNQSARRSEWKCRSHLKSGSVQRSAVRSIAWLDHSRRSRSEANIGEHGDDCGPNDERNQDHLNRRRSRTATNKLLERRRGPAMRKREGCAAWHREDVRRARSADRCPIRQHQAQMRLSMLPQQYRLLQKRRIESSHS